MNSYQERQEFLKSRIRQTRTQIEIVSKTDRPDREELSALEAQLRFHLSNQIGKLQFIRPNSLEDIAYREKQISEFSHKTERILPDFELLVFHGTPIYNAQKIIQSGQILSGKDLWGFATSGDPAGQFSVTTKDNIRNTILGHSDLSAFIVFLPAGVIFTIYAKDKQEYQMAQKEGHISNINFKEDPKRIHSLITTPENLKRVREWLDQNSFDYPVRDYDGFIIRAQRKFTKPQILNHQKTIA